MKRFLLSTAIVGLTSWSLTLATFATENAPVKEVKSKITNVTVYPGNALVTREVEVPEGRGLMELQVNPLPLYAVDGSLYSEGSDGVRILTTRYRTRAVEVDNRKEVQVLLDERKKLQIARREMEAKQKVITDNMQLLVKLEGFTEATLKTLSDKGLLSAEQVISLGKYIMDTRSTKSDDLVKIQQQIVVNQETDGFTQRKLSELTSGTSKTERDAIITINKANNGGGTIKLNYLVSHVNWSPQYKFRAGKEKDPILVEYLAAIRQQTGEDWNNVVLNLSTAQPMLNAAPPDLKSLTMSVVPATGAGQAATSMGNTRLMFNTDNSFGGNRFNPGMPGGRGGPPVQMTQAPNAGPQGQGGGKGDNIDYLSNGREFRKQAQTELNNKNYTAANQLWNDAAAEEQRAQLLMTKEEEAQIALADKFKGQSEGPTVNYKLADGISIPSRVDEQMVEVARLNLPPEYFYKAIPVLTKHVYRLANLTNKSEMVLLPGEATMYLGSDFVGRTSLPLVVIGEKFTVGLGVDPQLQVSRKLDEKQRKMKGANQELEFNYRILVSSYKSEPVKVQVWDRLPVSETDAININVMKNTPELSKDPLYLRDERIKNLLRWDVTVEPNTFGEKAMAITYQFKMELDKQLQVGKK